jgi:diguanylate cyclase (GGDEF)-like protein
MSWIIPLTLAPEDRPHTRAIRMALVRNLYHHARLPLVMQLATIWIFYAIIRTEAASLGWIRLLFAGLVAVTLLRTFLAFLGNRLERLQQRPNVRFAWFLASAALSGTVLGAIAFLVMPQLTIGPFLLFIIWFVGLSAAGCITMGSSPPCFLAYMVPSLGSLVFLGFQYDPFSMGPLFPVSMMIYMGLLAAASLQVHHTMVRSVLLTQRLEDMALRDPLTGLRNRRYLYEFMQEETPRVLRRWLLKTGDVLYRRSISLILVDLDLFKRVNDAFGHSAGDAVLMQVAKLLREIVRNPDLVLRWGGEEFLILALDSDRQAPPQIAVRVHEAMASHPFLLPGGQSLQLTCSVGYSLYPFHPDRPDGLGWEQVFRLADESLYGAKDLGRNRVRGILPGDGDPDAVVAALAQPAPDFPLALKAGLIALG